MSLLETLVLILVTVHVFGLVFSIAIFDLSLRATGMGGLIGIFTAPGPGHQGTPIRPAGEPGELGEPGPPPFGRDWEQQRDREIAALTRKLELVLIKDFAVEANTLQEARRDALLEAYRMSITMRHTGRYVGALL